MLEALFSFGAIISSRVCRQVRFERSKNGMDCGLCGCKIHAGDMAHRAPCERLYIMYYFEGVVSVPAGITWCPA